MRTTSERLRQLSPATTRAFNNVGNPEFAFAAIIFSRNPDMSAGTVVDYINALKNDIDPNTAVTTRCENLIAGFRTRGWDLEGPGRKAKPTEDSTKILAASSLIAVSVLEAYTNVGNRLPGVYELTGSSYTHRDPSIQHRRVIDRLEWFQRLATTDKVTKPIDLFRDLPSPDKAREDLVTALGNAGSLILAPRLNSKDQYPNFTRIYNPIKPNPGLDRISQTVVSLMSNQPYDEVFDARGVHRAVANGNGDQTTMNRTVETLVALCGSGHLVHVHNPEIQVYRNIMVDPSVARALGTVVEAAVVADDPGRDVGSLMKFTEMSNLLVPDADAISSLANGYRSPMRSEMPMAAHLHKTARRVSTKKTRH